MLLQQYALQYTDCSELVNIEKNNQLKNSDIFLAFAPNIDCGCMLELPC